MTACAGRLAGVSTWGRCMRRGRRAWGRPAGGGRQPPPRRRPVLTLSGADYGIVPRTGIALSRLRSRLHHDALPGLADPAVPGLRPGCGAEGRHLEPGLADDASGRRPRISIAWPVMHATS